MHGVEGLQPRQVDLVDRPDAARAGGQGAAEEGDVAAVERHLPDDLAERERHDRDVVAAQAQRRHADQRACHRRRRHGKDEDQQEVDVDAGQLRRGFAHEDRHALPVVSGAVPEVRGEVRRGVRADREERHVAEVEQAREPDHDVQPERHDHVRGGQDHVVEKLGARAEGERGERGESDQRQEHGRAQASVDRVHGGQRHRPVRSAPLLAERCTFAACVTGRARAGWVDSINAAAAQRGVIGTPAVFVNGTVVDLTKLTPEDLATMINP